MLMLWRCDRVADVELIAQCPCGEFHAADETLCAPSGAKVEIVGSNLFRERRIDDVAPEMAPRHVTRRGDGHGLGIAIPVVGGVRIVILRLCAGAEGQSGGRS